MRALARITIVIASLSVLSAPGRALAAWVPEGNPLCNVAGYQYPVAAVRTAFSAGPLGYAFGMFVVWQDMRADAGDIYYGAVSDFPPPDPAPGIDGTPVVVAPGNQWMPAVTWVNPVPSGAQWQGPAFVVVWNHGDALELRARRFGDGEEWGALGVPVSQSAGSSPFSPVLVGDGGMGTLVAWLDVNSAQRLVRAQRLDEHGNRMWGLNGVPVGHDTTVQSEPAIALAPGGGAYVLRTDHRIAGTLGYQRVLALYRLDGTGATAAGWPEEGVVVGSAQPGSFLMRGDEAGGVFVAWREPVSLSDASLGRTTRVTRIGADGAPVAGWSLAGIDAVVRADGHRDLDDIDLDGTGGVVLVLEYEQVVGGPAGSGTDLVVQRLLGNGARPANWPAAGHTLCGASAHQYEARLIGKQGGLIAAWRDDRSGESDLYGLRLEPDGTLAEGWEAGGTLLCGAASTQSDVRIAPNKDGGALFVWQDRRNLGTGPDLYMQTVTASGELDVPGSVGITLALSAPVPSPARDRVEFVLESATETSARVEVLDLSGRIVQRWSIAVAPGRNPIRWDLTDASGHRVAPGAYHLRVATPRGARTRQVIVLD